MCLLMLLVVQGRRYQDVWYQDLRFPYFVFQPRAPARVMMQGLRKAKRSYLGRVRWGLRLWYYRFSQHQGKGWRLRRNPTCLVRRKDR